MLYNHRTIIVEPPIDNPFNLQTGDAVHYISNSIFCFYPDGHFQVSDSSRGYSMPFILERFNHRINGYLGTTINLSNGDCTVLYTEYETNDSLNINNILIRIDANRCLLLEHGWLELDIVDINAYILVRSWDGQKEWRINGIVNYDYDSTNADDVAELQAAVTKWHKEHINEFFIEKIYARFK